MITTGRLEELEQLRERLERQYEDHSERMAWLMSRRVNRKTAMLNTAEVLSHRRNLADAARALRRMAEGRYGRCEQCGAEIPFEELVSRPEQECCGGCEAAISA